MLSTPVLFLIFNRPDNTKRVFERIRQARPNYVFIAADGPRKSHPDDYDKCRVVREMVLDGIDWPCKVYTLFRDNNLGCGLAISEAITWFFEKVEEGIILEDDCLPDNSFFMFCQKTLSQYRSQEQVMHISGTNFQCGRKHGYYSYFFSKYPHTWGWATWRRAWQKYRLDISKILNLPDELMPYNTSKVELIYWENEFNHLMAGELDTWDYSWFRTVWSNKGIAITPNENLILNIGVGVDATHTFSFTKKYEKCKVVPIDEIRFGGTIKQNVEADEFTYKNFIDPQPGLVAKLVNATISRLGKF